MYIRAVNDVGQGPEPAEPYTYLKVPLKVFPRASLSSQVVVNYLPGSSLL